MHKKTEGKFNDDQTRKNNLTVNNTTITAEEALRCTYKLIF